MNILINSNFGSVKPSALLARAQAILTAMTGNASFPEPWPATVPSLAQIQADFNALQSAVTATTEGDRTRIVERNTARGTLANDLGQLALYVLSIAKGNQEMLATTGFPLRQRNARALVLDVPSSPTGVKALAGAVSGTLLIRAHRVAGAGSYDVQITMGDPTVEANWIAAGSFKICRRIELSGLTPLKTYSVRLRALGVAGPGAWSIPVSVLVV